MSVPRAGLAAAGAAIAVGATVFGWSTRPPADTAAPPSTTMPLDGAALFRSKGCATCHDGPDSTSPMDGFPDLSDAAVWAGTRREGLAASAYLAESIGEPWAFSAPGFTPSGPASGMPGLGLAAAEIDALVAYLLGS